MLVGLALDAQRLNPLLLPVFLALGALAGVAHAAALRWNVALLTSSGSVFAAIALQVLRFGILAGLLFLVALQGAAALLATTLGLLAARAVTVRRLAKVAP